MIYHILIILGTLAFFAGLMPFARRINYLSEEEQYKLFVEALEEVNEIFGVPVVVEYEGYFDSKGSLHVQEKDINSDATIH